MYLIFIVIGIILFARYKTCNLVEGKIRLATSLEESMKYRKYLKWLGLLFTIIFVVGVLLSMRLVNSDLNYWTTGGGKIITYVLGIFFVTNQGYIIIAGNVSTYNKEKWLKKHKQYVLFLRAFEDDNYDYSSSTNKPLLGFTKFNENAFILEVSKYIDACAIGLRDETYAPFGADRVYLEHSTWQQETIELINRASFVFVLVNDSPNFIWQIESLKDYLDKAIFFVDNLNKYESLKNKLSGIINFPDITDKNLSSLFYIEFVCKDTLEKPSAIISQVEDFEEESKIIMSYLINQNRIPVTKKSGSLMTLITIGYFLLAFIVFPLIIALNYKFADLLLDAINLKSDVLLVIFILFFFFIEWILYMITKVSFKFKNLSN